MGESKGESDGNHGDILWKSYAVNAMLTFVFRLERPMTFDSTLEPMKSYALLTWSTVCTVRCTLRIGDER